MADPAALLRENALRLLGLELGIEERLARRRELRSFPEAASSVLSEIADACAAERAQLEAWLGDGGLAAAAAPLEEEASGAGPAAMIEADCVVVARVAAASSALVTLALRLYDPTLREIAPRHLRLWTATTVRLMRLIPGLTVAALDQQGLSCRCICPMCSIGACGCRAAGRAHVDGTWVAAASAADGSPGLVLPPPREGSQLAGAGVRGGDRLLAVDGQPVVTFMDVQKGLRGHGIGGEAVLSISRGDGEPQEVRVRHVGDLPPG